MQIQIQIQIQIHIQIHIHIQIQIHIYTGRECDYVETASIKDIAGRSPTSLAQFLADNEQAFRRLGAD